MTELKLDGLGKKDMLKFKELKNEREKVINNSPLSPINNQYKNNIIANMLHPKQQYVKVIDIINENEDTKTFVLAPNTEKGTTHLAYFKPGQYVSVKIRIGKCIYKRPYTISSSPKMALENKYMITIKKVKKGIISNYFFNEVEIGNTFTVSGPCGNFTYERLRDAKNVIAIAGGSGITPFISMAEAINDGIINCNLTIIYGVKREEDIIFKERLSKLTKNHRIKIVCVLSEEENKKYETGLISDRIIDKYMTNETSVFVCGPIDLYEHMNEVLKKYNLAKKYIRTDLFFSKIDVKCSDDFELKVLTKDKEFIITCNGKETLLSAIENSGILAPSSCHVGVCGLCRSKLISGKIKTFDGDMREVDKELNYIHPCISFPESNVVIKLPN